MNTLEFEFAKSKKLCGFLNEFCMVIFRDIIKAVLCDFMFCLYFLAVERLFRQSEKTLRFSMIYIYKNKFVDIVLNISEKCFLHFSFNNS